MPVGLRHAGRSAIQPPASFAKLERLSETPSITPSATAGAPRLARNAGRIAVAASCAQSEKRLARPMPRTPRVSQRFEGAREGAVEFSLMLSAGFYREAASRAPGAAADSSSGDEAAKMRSAQMRRSLVSSHRTGV